MSVATLLAELESAGIRLGRHGERLVADVLPSADLDAYRNQITENKSALMGVLYEREAIASLTNQLEAGWRWMQSYPNHPEHDVFLERWIAKLREYEQVHCIHEGMAARRARTQSAHTCVGECASVRWRLSHV